ncbi:hypothetical protein D9615_001032 [Tricholomella constricta]|uniref:DNA (cytosine-5-)-methyltransferase n=1 Tax=Tricholomella constricta TaxID=117010 RepID=A0A8H5M924_9AGAR|nr:hypothetical protein D9615_001032 [Tricholomella constricta]
MARRRPNAFEVSFGEIAPDASYTSASQQPVASSSSIDSRPMSLKRKSDSQGPGDSRNTKRQQLPPPAFYVDRGGELESGDLVLAGEDPFLGEDADADQDDSKPIRVLMDFAVYDPTHGAELVSLSAIEEDDGVDRQFEAAGFAFPYVANEEDEGQEDGDVVGGGDEQEVKYANDPVYIETQFAWYILKAPAPSYAPYFQHFFTPWRIAQMVVSTALRYPRRSYEEFLERFVCTVDTFGRTYKEEHIWQAILEIQDAVNEYDDPEKLKASPLIRHILRKAAPASTSRPARRKGAAPRNRKAPPIKSLLGNLDLAVMKKENQNPTHVTPRIAALAQGLVYEDLVVVGGRPPPEDKALKEAQKAAAHKRLCRLVLKAKQTKKRVGHHRAHYIGTGARYLKAVEIDEVLYKIGDFVIIPIRSRKDKKDGKTYVPPANLPDDIEDIAPTSTIADYFWFARILYGDADAGMFHVQWLQHSSQTMLEELGHPQELFYNDICDHVLFTAVTHKIVVHEGPSPPPDAHEYFVKFTYDINQATYTSIDSVRLDISKMNNPPYNCMVCPVVQQQEQEKADLPLNDSQKIVNGVAYGGQNYHYEDFVLYRAEKGPANIGYITGFNFLPLRGGDVRTEVYLKRVGRISSIANVLPDDVLRDERHVFLTDDDMTVPLKDFICVCYVFPHASIPNLKRWLSLSPLHFYIKYKFPSMAVRLWTQREPVSCAELGVCTPCTKGKLDELKTMGKFLADAKRHPLRALDIFGGVGAFSMGLAEGSGCLKLTDLVEISPSAAKTTMRNFPDVIVHNQCANEVLRHSIKEKLGQKPEPLKQLYDGNTIVPSLQKPDIIVAGVPCQSHSTMNKYKRADDIKSNLVLTALSFVDHLRPSLFYFENVPGFQRFSFDAVQSEIHKLEGGIPMGGLKLVVRALVEMRYQVRFGVLQAGHYGAPQRRHRFFLVAAIDGHPLPEFPRPSHDFENSYLDVKLPVGNSVRPFPASNGTAPHPFVSIDDAISDLPRFDWKHPKAYNLSAAKQREMRQRGWEIPALPCNSSSTHCGYSDEKEYHHEPKTTYQAVARVKPTKNLQQFTRTFAPKRVERLVSVPLKANADYRDLRPDLQEWQTANPLSSVARKNYRSGLFGRLDKSQFFPTTVTNMDPTAKQSRVLNPYCHRMVTVRELARSQGFPDHFVFEAIGHNIVTMHRQIGNAVPLPVGVALGRELRAARLKRWLTSRQDAIHIDSDDD